MGIHFLEKKKTSGKGRIIIGCMLKWCDVFGAILDKRDTERGGGEGKENDDDDDDDEDDEDANNNDNDDAHIDNCEGHAIPCDFLPLQTKRQQRSTWQHIPQEDLKWSNGKTCVKTISKILVGLHDGPYQPVIKAGLL